MHRLAGMNAMDVSLQRPATSAPFLCAGTRSGILKRCNIKLPHLHKGPDHTRAFFRVRHQRTELFGHYLPGYAEPVLTPATPAFAAATGGECVPVMIDLFLVFAGDYKGNGFIEC